MKNLFSKKRSANYELDLLEEKLKPIIVSLDKISEILIDTNIPNLLKRPSVSPRTIDGLKIMLKRYHEQVDDAVIKLQSEYDKWKKSLPIRTDQTFGKTTYEQLYYNNIKNFKDWVVSLQNMVKIKENECKNNTHVCMSGKGKRLTNQKRKSSKKRKSNKKILKKRRSKRSSTKRKSR